MFIRLTRSDGLPIWINASFVVTVEPTKTGGSIVVPIGDGLDYDVREAPESVLALLNEAPPARVVPVPPPKALTPMPDDVSPDIGFRSGVDAIEEEEEKEEEEEEEPASKPAEKKKPRRKKAAPAKAKDVPPPEKQEAPAVPAVPASAEPEDFHKIVADLKGRKCRTAKRARNAIKSYFGKTDDAEIDHIIEAMINRGYMLIGADGHITWLEN